MHCAFHKDFISKSYLFLYFPRNCETCFDMSLFKMYIILICIKKCCHFFNLNAFKGFKMVILILKMSEEYQTAARLHKLLVNLGPMGWTFECDILGKEGSSRLIPSYALLIYEQCWSRLFISYMGIIWVALFHRFPIVFAAIPGTYGCNMGLE